MVKSGLTKDELIAWGGVEVFNQAFALCNSGDVKDVAYDDDTLVVSGKIIQPSGWEMPVSAINGDLDHKMDVPRKSYV